MSVKRPPVEVTRRTLVLLAVLVSVLSILEASVGATGARASQLIDRDATGVRLEVDSKGEALLTYSAGGVLKHVLAWGAVNAFAPAPDVTQAEFQLDYGGGWGKYHSPYWKTFVNVCKAYAGPALPFQVAACTAPDGSHWALQSWQRDLPDYGLQPSREQAVWELHLSHWTGAPAQLDVHVNWAYRRFDHLYGTYSYDGNGVYGFHSTSAGKPLDAFGRNIYVDALDSDYGAGWKRVNSFLTHRPHGAFCYGFYPHAGRSGGQGTEYRATAIGPGVTPDVTWTGAAPGPYDATAQLAANAAIRAIGDRLCHPV